jgi:hypothetical protein
LLRSDGRIFLLASVGNKNIADLKDTYTAWAASTGMRLAKPRSIPERNPDWLLAVATSADSAVAAGKKP